MSVYTQAAKLGKKIILGGIGYTVAETAIDSKHGKGTTDKFVEINVEKFLENIEQATPDIIPTSIKPNTPNIDIRMPTKIRGDRGKHPVNTNSKGKGTLDQFDAIRDNLSGIEKLAYAAAIIDGGKHAKKAAGGLILAEILAGSYSTRGEGAEPLSFQDRFNPLFNIALLAGLAKAAR